MTEAKLAGPAAVIARLHTAINQHDLDTLVACFDPEYANETPAHPARSFRGREQVRRNWTQILGAVPDLAASLLRHVVDGDTSWAEWDWSGTRPDGQRMAMRGVTIQGVRDGRITWTRFYMEPVEEGGGGVESAVRQHVTGRPV